VGLESKRKEKNKRAKEEILDFIHGQTSVFCFFGLVFKGTFIYKHESQQRKSFE